MTNKRDFLQAALFCRPVLALALAYLAAWTLSGCMSMSGLSGSASYACKAPAGVTCDSVSGTYVNAVQNNLPGQRRQANSDEVTPPRSRAADGIGSAAATGAIGGAPLRVATAPSQTASPSVLPLRSPARILRLWFKPWEDADRDLHDQGHIYIRIDDGQWLVEHAQRQIRDAYAPLRPPARASGGASEPRDAGSATQANRPTGPLSLPGLAPPAGRPQMPADAAAND